MHFDWFDFAHHKYAQCKQKGFAPIIILVGILVVAAIGGAYYFFKVKTPEQMICTPDAKICPDGSSVIRVGPNCEFAPCPKFSPSPTPTNEIANWKTYTSTRLGFSVKYPDEVVLEDQKDGSLSLEILGPTQRQNAGFYDGLALNFSTGALSGQTLAELVNKEVESTKTTPGAEVLIAPNKYIIGGVEGYSYRIRGNGEFTVIYVSQKQNHFLRIVDGTVDPTRKGFQQTADKILSTFKFLE